MLILLKQNHREEELEKLPTLCTSSLDKNPLSQEDLSLARGK